MKTLVQFINESSDYINAGKNADKQFDTIQNYCSKKMYRKWMKARTVSGDGADLYFIAKDLIDVIGYLRITLMHEDWRKGNIKAWVYCDKSYPIDAAKGLPEFVNDIVAPIFKDIDTFKSYIDKNGKTE